MSRFSQTLLFGLSLLTIFACHAEDKTAPVSYTAGTDYEVLTTPIHTLDPNKIEVTEFFWYGCPHCYHFEPSIITWLKTIPNDVVFNPVPAMWHPTMELHAKMFYTAQQLNKLDVLHEKFFNAMQVGKLKLDSQAEIAKLFTEAGVDEETFNKTFTSFGVDSLVKQAQAKANGAQLTGTPELLVNGKYRITAKTAGSQPKMLKVADFLIEKERKEKK